MYLGGVSTLPNSGELPDPKGPGFGSLDEYNLKIKISFCKMRVSQKRGEINERSCKWIWCTS